MRERFFDWIEEVTGRHVHLFNRPSPMEYGDFKVYHCRCKKAMKQVQVT